MLRPWLNAPSARLAGLCVVLALHGALLYSLWHDRVLPPPAQATTLFVDLLTDPPKLERPKPDPPKPRPIKRERPVQPPPPQQLAAQTPLVLPSDPIAPPHSPEPPRIEVPVEPAPPAPPPKPMGPAVLSGELALKVVLRVELDETGRIDRATIKISSGYARIDEAALATVKRWRCSPASRDGAAVRAVAIQPFNFVLEGQ